MRSPVSAACKKCATRNVRGVCHQVDLSRLEEGMGRTGHRCDQCSTLFVVIPGRDGGPARVAERPASCDPGRNSRTSPEFHC